MGYFGTIINPSATINAKAAAKIENGAFLAATLTKDGAAVAKAGEAPIGIFIAETETIEAGEDTTIQVKDMGLGMTGAAVDAGDLLAADANGKLIKATCGAFALAVALETATAADQVISIQISKPGYTAASAGVGG